MKWVARPESSKGVLDASTPFEDSGRAPQPYVSETVNRLQFSTNPQDFD
jgi:hypothetical protein